MEILTSIITFAATVATRTPAVRPLLRLETPGTSIESICVFDPLEEIRGPWEHGAALAFIEFSRQELVHWFDGGRPLGRHQQQ